MQPHSFATADAFLARVGEYLHRDEPLNNLLLGVALPPYSPWWLIAVGMGSAILGEAALSFLGLGVQPPQASWGSMLSDARDSLFFAPWASIFPGIAIFVCVLGLNLLGDGLRDRFDPRSVTRQ